MSEDFREQIDCKYIDADGHCLKYTEPGYTDWCVLGPCSDYERRCEDEDQSDGD